MTAQLRGLTLDKFIDLQHVANHHKVQVQPSYVTAQLRGRTLDKNVALQHVATPHGVQVQPSYVTAQLRDSPVTWAYVTQVRCPSARSYSSRSTGTAQLCELTSHKYVALQNVATPHGVQVQPSYVSLLHTSTLPFST